MISSNSGIVKLLSLSSTTGNRILKNVQQLNLFCYSVSSIELKRGKTRYRAKY